MLDSSELENLVARSNFSFIFKRSFFTRSLSKVDSSTLKRVFFTTSLSKVGSSTFKRVFFTISPSKVRSSTLKRVFFTVSPSKVRSSTFKRGFSNTSVRKIINTVGNLDLIGNTPIITASANTLWDVGFGVLTLVTMVGIEIGIHGTDILNAEFSDAVLDIFDCEVPEGQQADLEALYPDDGEWPSTPNIVDNLNTTPGAVDVLPNILRAQMDQMDSYVRHYLVPMLEDAAIQIRSGNFNLDPNSREYRALMQLLRNLDHHEGNLRGLAERIQEVINRIEPGSVLWENHPELHSNFRGLHAVAVAAVVELNNIRSRSILFGRDIRENLAQLNRSRR